MEKVQHEKYVNTIKQFPRKKRKLSKIYYPKTPQDVYNLIKKYDTLVGLGAGNTYSRIDESLSPIVGISSKRIDHIQPIKESRLVKYVERRLDDPIVEHTKKIHKYLFNVGAGTTISAINDYLEKKNMMLPITLHENDTIAGASQTGSHESGIHYGNICKYIHSFRLLFPNGDFVTVERTKKISKSSLVIADDLLFNCIACGLGSFGVLG